MAGSGGNVYFEQSTEDSRPMPCTKLKLKSQCKLAVDVAVEQHGRYFRCDCPEGFYVLTARFLSHSRVKLEQNVNQGVTPNEAEERKICRHRKFGPRHHRLCRTKLVRLLGGQGHWKGCMGE
jgi:hypothetical protein